MSIWVIINEHLCKNSLKVIQKMKYDDTSYKRLHSSTRA